MFMQMRITYFVCTFFLTFRVEST